MRRLFTAMPFGWRESPTGRFNFDRVYSGAIKAAAEAAGWESRRADEITTPGVILDQVLREIVEADLLIADLSTENGNVYYELGVRQSLAGGGTLLIAQSSSRFPFDIAQQRVLIYEPTQAGIADLRSRIETALAQFENDPEAQENPVARALEHRALTTDPRLDSGAFEADFHARVERATSLEQLVGVWAWARTRTPLPGPPLTALAQRLSEVGEWATAAEVLSASVAALPDDYETHRQLGWCLRQLGPDHFARATAEFETALRLNPADPETLGMLGGLHKRQGRYDLAARYYDRAAEIAPTAWNSRVNQAAVATLSDPGQPERGLSLYRELLDAFAASEQASSDEWFEIMRGEACFVLGDDAAAAHHYELAASLASSVSSLEGAVSQLRLFAREGYRANEARRLIESVRARIEARRTSRPASTPQSRGDDRHPVIVHISDLHFDKDTATGKHRFDRDPSGRSLAEHLIDDVSDGPWSFEPSQLHLVVSGDLVWSGLEEEFRRAEHALVEIIEGLDIPRERVYVVPGNHDVNWNLAAANNRRRFDNFLRFVAAFYGEEEAKKRYPNVGFTLADPPPAPDDVAAVVIDDKARLVFACINSCVYETAGHHYGYVGERQLKKLRDQVLSLEHVDEYVKVAVVHHHLHAFPEYVPLPSGDSEVWTDTSTIRDGAIVEQMLEKLGFSIVLHGHKHRPQARETLVRHAAAQAVDANPLIVCGAGSVSCLELEHSVPNQYEIVELRQIPRRRGVDFARLTWRTLDLAAGADWVTASSWDLAG
jgi:tetratricopeptide (TPR) repeat protein